MAPKFLQFTNHHIRVELIGKSVYRCVGMGLEMSVNYFFMEMQELTSVKNSLEKLDNELHVKVKKCVK